MAILIALHEENIAIRDIFVFGELGLDGRVKSSSTLFPIVLSLKEQGVLKKAVVPKEAMRYLSYINGIEFIAVDNLIEAIDVFKSGKFERSSYEKPKYGAERININGKDIYTRER